MAIRLSSFIKGLHTETGKKEKQKETVNFTQNFQYNCKEFSYIK
jgi:hypothetical protein